MELFNQLLNDPYQTHLANLYGPTEATVDVSYFNCPSGVKLDKIPIGKPIDNISIYILNGSNQLQPLGVPGELCISGVGLAEGYLNRPELTNAKFVPNPFIDTPQGTDLSAVSDTHSSSDVLFQPSFFKLHTLKIYRTGDLARWLPDGNIEFLGRMDYQVKIRGFRVELEEVEVQLLKFPLINEVVVLDKEDQNGNKFLCAFMVSPQELSTSELKAYIAETLPDYMIPSYFVQLKEIPLTANGKIDKAKLLTLYSAANPLPEYVAPSGEIEELLVEIWQEVLGIEKVGVNQNFFDLGGNSLLMIQVRDRLQTVFNQEIPMVDLFTYPTISLLRNFLDRKKAEEPLFVEDSLVQVDERAKMQQEAMRRRKTVLESRHKTDEQ